MLTRKTATITVCLALALGLVPAAAVPVATGTLSVAVHPALLLLEPRAELRARPIPLGLVADAASALDFLSYFNGEVPEPSVDLGSLVIGLSNVDLLPFGLPTSPTSLRLTISADSAVLESSGGDVDPLALLQHVSEAPTRAALDRTELLPVWSVFIRNLRIDLGSSISAVPFDAVGDTSLISVLNGDPVSPSTRYGIDLRSVADVSLAARVTLGLSIPTPRAEIVPALSVSVPVSIAHAESRVGAWIETGASGTPNSAGNSWEVVYWYPGAGIGVGARLSAGVAWTTPQHTIGFTMFSLVSGWNATGVSLSAGGNATPVQVKEAGFRPAPVLVYVWDSDSGSGTSYSVAAQAGYRDGPIASLTAVASLNRLSVVAGIGYERGMRAGAGLGVRIGGLYVEPVIEIRHNQNTGTTIGGLLVSLARVRTRGLGAGR